MVLNSSDTATRVTGCVMQAGWSRNRRERTHEHVSGHLHVAAFRVS